MREPANRFAQPHALSATRRAETLTGWLLVLPALLGFVAFHGVPAVRAVGISFTDWNLLRAPHFVGLDNYAAMLEDGRFWNGMKLSLYYVLLNIPLQVALGLGLAVAMHRLTTSLFVRSVVLLPYLLWVSIASCTDPPQSMAKPVWRQAITSE